LNKNIAIEHKKKHKTPVQSVTKLSKENQNELLKAMKIGFYMDFHRKGLLTDEQLEMLIAMQDKPVEKDAQKLN